MNKKLILTIFIFAFSLMSANAKQYHEKYYQSQWCLGKGQMEYKLNDYTRVDCLTNTHAVEFDFGKKWAECLGQSLHYAYKTGRNPACVLIMENSKDYQRFNNVQNTFKKYNVALWQIKSLEYQE